MSFWSASSSSSSPPPSPTISEIATNDVLQSRMVAALTAAYTYVEKIITELDIENSNSYRAWLHREDDAGLNARERRLLNNIEILLYDAEHYLRSAAQVLENAPFAISPPLRVNKVSTVVIRQNDVTENMDIGYYGDLLRHEPSYNLEDDFVFPLQTARHLKRSAQKQWLLKVFKSLLQLYKDIKRMFFTRREMTQELAEPLIKAMEALQRLLNRAELLLSEGQNVRSRSKSRSKSSSSSSRSKSPFTPPARRRSSSGGKVRQSAYYKSPFKGKTASPFSKRSPTTKPSRVKPAVYDLETGLRVRMTAREEYNNLLKRKKNKRHSLSSPSKKPTAHRR